MDHVITTDDNKAQLVSFIVDTPEHALRFVVQHFRMERDEDEWECVPELADCIRNVFVRAQGTFGTVALPYLLAAAEAWFIANAPRPALRPVKRKATGYGTTVALDNMFNGGPVVPPLGLFTNVSVPTAATNKKDSNLQQDLGDVVRALQTEQRERHAARGERDKGQAFKEAEAFWFAALANATTHKQVADLLEAAIIGPEPGRDHKLRKVVERLNMLNPRALKTKLGVVERVEEIMRAARTGTIAAGHARADWFTGEGSKLIKGVVDQLDTIETTAAQLSHELRHNKV